MKQDSVSTKEVILALTSVPNLTRRLLDGKNEYNVLLLEILKYDYYDDDSQFPNRKELEAQIGLTPSKFKSLLDKLFSDFKMLFSQEDAAFVVTDIIYEIYVRYYEKTFMFRCKLPLEFRVGEDVQLSFLKAIVGCSNFYVQKVYHEIYDNKQVVCVWLKGGMSNWHEMYLDDKAKSEFKYDWDLGIRKR